MRFFIKIVFVSLVTIVIVTGCHDDDIITDKNAGLIFSTDTVFFDTIFTTIGSVTHSFKIYNPHDQDIVIQDIYLAGGNSSYFNLNVDGDKGNAHKNITLQRKDSIYVFVEAIIDPLGSNTPMVINDSIICITNGNLQSIKLVAFGQDVNLFSNEIIKSQTWTNEKPYLIYNNVVIDYNEVLIIEPGTQIYLHNYSNLIVRGRLEAKGSLENPVIFTGDRFDGFYDRSAGQWGFIYIDSRSTGNLLEYVIIKNATAGLWVGYPEKESSPSVEIRNCMIFNSALYGIFAFNAEIQAYNTIIADCGEIAMLLFMGGNYNFYHCTISNVSANSPGYYDTTGYKPRNLPSLYFANYIDNILVLDENFRFDTVEYQNDLNLNFYNSILYGILDQEIKFKKHDEKAFNYKFDHCLIKNNKDSLEYSNTEHFISVILNEDPRFVNDSISHGAFDFQLDTLSFAIDSGDIELIQGIPQLQLDFNGNSRTADGKPDLGAFERYE
jgi:hypothetical protein